MTRDVSRKVRVWDLPTRVFHWGLGLSFAGAYLLAESERVRHFHVMFGYTVLALVVFRLLWGFVGSRYARFSSFAFGPRAVVEHVRGLVRRDVPEHPGHTPSGTWAIWLMLGLAAMAGVTGYLHLNEIGGEAMEEVHEFAANAWLVLVFVHVAGVLVSSFAERQNLVRAMVTGYKRLSISAEGVRNASVLGVLMLMGVIGFWGATVLSGGDLILPADSGETVASVAHPLSSHEDSDDD